MIHASLIGRLICASVCMIICAVCTPLPVSGDFPLGDTKRKEVLIIHSYHPSLSWTRDVTKGIEEGFGKSGESLDLSMEYMDTRRYRGPDYRERLDKLFLYKLSDKQFDLIIVSDNDAFKFALANRASLFPNVPIVFCGINNYSHAMLAGHKKITGVAEDVSLQETLDVALKLHEGTKRVVVIGRTSVPADRTNRDAFVSLLNTYRGPAMFVFWDDFNTERLQQDLPLLGQGTIVFINGLTADRTGKQLMYGDTTQFIRAHSSVPLYSLWDVYLGYGIVGGKLISAYAQGKLAGELAARILRGEDPDNIPVVHADAANKFMFDYKELSRFQISKDKLPEGSMIINQPSSFYVVNKAYIQVGATLLLFFSGIIVLLVINIAGRKKA